MDTSPSHGALGQATIAPMKAYVTLLSTENYLPGVLCLAKSLLATGTRYPLVVAISAGMPAAIDEQLVARGLPTIRLPATSPLPRALQQGDHHWGHTFDKLHLFGLTAYSKLVYLDSDMMILDTLDELFDKPHMSAVAAGRQVHPDWVRMNSGLMVIEPEEGLPQRIGLMLDEAVREVADSELKAVGDQDLINAFYPGWPTSQLQLDEGYNVFHEHLEDYLASGKYALEPAPSARPSDVKPIKVIHFTGPIKPWMPKAVWRHLRNRIQQRTRTAEQATFRMYRELLVGAHST